MATKSVPVPAKKAEPAPRGADDPELTELLGSRQASNPLHAPEVRKTLIDLKNRATEWDRSSATAVGLDGTDLITLYMRHADATLGFASFRALLLQWWPLDVSSAYARMRIAKLTTMEQLRKYRYTKCRQGTAIVTALGLKSLTELEAKPLALPAGFPAKTVLFKEATNEQLAAVLRLLKAPPAQVISVRHGEKLLRAREWLRKEMLQDAAVAKLEPVAFLREGVIHVRVTAGGPEQATAASRFYARLAKQV